MARDELAEARKKSRKAKPRPGTVLSHEEVLVILSEQAKEGSVTAAAALERALRAVARQEEDSFDTQLGRILTK